MSKSILIIDTPESCAKCILFTNPRDGWCMAEPSLYVANYPYTYKEKRSEHCPLEEINCGSCMYSGIKDFTSGYCSNDGSNEIGIDPDDCCDLWAADMKGKIGSEDGDSHDDR